MRVELVHFDEVFDVAAGRGDFSFRSGGHAYYGVTFRSNAIPQAGAAYAVAFAEPGNWASVLGWRELPSGKPILKYPTWSEWVEELGDILMYGPFFAVGGFLFGGAGGAAAVLAAAACAVFFKIRRVTRRNREVALGLMAGIPSGQPA
ncbi:hypothetical protein [Massilia consociata]|uniref:Uncharacterized protein n=1 Tax=Massilia consociata TaxID=760117 RepID=A0ABV6FEU4_9BURK